MILSTTLIFICLTIIQNVFSLECYATDLKSLRLRGVNAVPLVRNCWRHYGTPAIGGDFKCATLVADSEHARLNFVSCLPSKKSCSDLENILESFPPFTSLSFKITNCTECQENLCNAVDQMIQVKVGAENHYYEDRVDVDDTPKYEDDAIYQNDEVHYEHNNNSSVYFFLILIAVGVLVVIVGIHHFVRKRNDQGHLVQM